MLEHLFRYREVGDHAVLQGPDCGDVAWRAAEHVLGLQSDRFHGLAAAARFFPDCDHGRFIEHDALPRKVDQRVGGAQIDGKIVGEVSPKPFQHDAPRSASEEKQKLGNLATRVGFSNCGDSSASAPVVFRLALSMVRLP